MEIYVVQSGDDIYSISNKFGISIEKLIQDNGLKYPYDLVVGQTIVITYPKQSYTVQHGDTLDSIAGIYNITIMQLLRNNPSLFDRENLIVGETLVISYNTVRSITTNGYAYPYIKKETLIKILPNLTYLSVFNYTTTEKGVIYTYQDDSEIIEITKAYGVIPMMMLTTLSLQGVPNLEISYNILLHEEFQDKNIDEFYNIMKSKGYGGINIVFNYLNEDNEPLYQRFVQKIANRLQPEGYLFFITVNYQIHNMDNKIFIDKVDYLKISNYVNGMIFLNFVWGTNYGPPAPVSNITYLKTLIDYVVSLGVPPDDIVIGKPILGYDWRLPYIPDKSSATSLTINSVYSLALEVGTVIQFDEVSQTPYYYYKEFNTGIPSDHIVWFIDARSIDALDKFIYDYGLNGSGIWNVMVYYPQLWTIINSQFEIIKLT